MKLNMVLKEWYTSTSWRKLEIDTDDYPELKGMSKADAQQHIIDKYDENPEAKNLIEKHNNDLVNVSRSVIYASSGKDWKEVARKKAKAFNLKLGNGI